MRLSVTGDNRSAIFIHDVRSEWKKPPWSFQ